MKEKSKEKNKKISEIDEEKKESRRSMIYAILLLLASIAIGIIVMTYSKYT